MTDAYVQLAADGPGKKVDTSELAVGPNIVERQRIALADPASAAALAAVENASPGASDYGLVTRPIGPSSATGTPGTPVAASTSSQTLLAANAARKGAVIRHTTAGTGNGGPEMFLKLGTAASPTTYTEVVKVGETYEVPYGYTGTITAVWPFAPTAGAQAKALVTELT